MSELSRTTRVLITGGQGFLGGYIRAEFERRGFTAVSAPHIHECDLRDVAAVNALFERVEPELVIHLAAAVGGIGANQREPGRFFFDNAAMALYLIEAARLYATARFVGIGTTCSYPREAPLPLRESSLWDGAPDSANAPYGHAKRFMYAQMEAYGRQYGLESVMVIPANLYGPFDHFDLETSHVIPGMLRRFDEARDRRARYVEVWGDGSPTREFLHAHDAARGIVAAALKRGLGGVLNLGSGREISMRDLAETIREVAGFEGEIRWDTTRPNGQPRRYLDSARARSEIGFEARTDLEAGLAETLAWYRAQVKERRAA